MLASARTVWGGRAVPWRNERAERWQTRGWQVALALLWMAITACSPAPSARMDNLPPDDPGPPVYGGHLRVALEGETNNWLPGRGSHVAPAALTVAMALFDPLVRADHEGQYHPYLAESLTPNE